jgi:hypothetical protein
VDLQTQLVSKHYFHSDYTRSKFRNSEQCAVCELAQKCVLIQASNLCDAFLVVEAPTMKSSKAFMMMQTPSHNRCQNAMYMMEQDLGCRNLVVHIELCKGYFQGRSIGRSKAQRWS